MSGHRLWIKVSRWSDPNVIQHHFGVYNPKDAILNSKLRIKSSKVYVNDVNTQAWTKGNPKKALVKLDKIVKESGLKINQKKSQIMTQVRKRNTKWFQL